MAISREQVVQSAEKLVSRGKIEAAIREYRKVLAENPNDANTLNRVGDLYARIQRIDEAVDLFNQIAAQYTQEGFFVKAIAIYKKIIKLNPTHLEVYERLAELYHKQGLVNEARTQYQVLADYYLKHENTTSAVAMYQKMAEVEPENPTYHVKLAELYHQQQLTEKAMGEYRTIAELMLGVGHAQEAAQVYERALSVDATNIPFITDAVLKLREAGHNAAAARFLAAAVERNPQAERVARLVGVDDGGAAAPAVEAASASAASPAPAEGYEALPDAEAVELSWGTEGLGMPSADLFDSPPFAFPEVPEMPAIPAGFGAEFADAADAAHAAEAEAPAPSAAAIPAAAAPAPADPEEFDLDLDEVFVLDMESEDEPASLVKPPPDMLGDAPRRPAWAQAAEEADEAAAAPLMAAAPAPAPEIHDGSPEDFELPGIAIEEATEAGDAADADEADEAEETEETPIWATEAEPEAPAWAAEPEIELDLESDLDFESLAPSLPESEPEPQEASAEPSAASVAAEKVEMELDFGGELDLQPLPDLEPLPAAPPESSLPASPAEPVLPVLPVLPFLPASPSVLRIDPDLLERTAAELHPQVHQREEDLVTEAEVLAKYGLEEKALDRLREALKVNPRHLPAHALAVQLHLDKGRHSRVVELANQMAKAAAEIADRDPWLKVRRRLLNAGYRLDGDQVLSGPAPATPAAPAVRPPAAPKTARGVDDLLRGLLGKESPRRPPAPAASPASATPPAPTAPAAKRDPISPPPRPAPEPPAPALAAPPESPESPAPQPAAPLPPAPALGQTFNLLEIGALVESEDLECIDFPPPSLPPSVAVPPASPPAVPAAPAKAAAPSAGFGDDTGMSWLDEAEAGRGKEGGGGQLFADEDDFFDLAGELEQELSREEGLRGSDLLVQPVEQSLEQIVEGFKKGVAENLSPTDFDTHFNLGIAYREMGLLDEAIGEFQLASKSPSLLVACCSMLGLCFLDKGLPELAIKWYRRGLESPNVSEDDSLGLLYDMGNVYDTQGDTDTAYKTFVEIYGINTNYRDVVARIEELGRDR